jgi:triacylglycerol lipase
VRTTADQIVTPIDSAMLAGALNIAVQDLCPEATTTHGGIPGDPVVLATLRSSLGTDAPRPPKKVTC